MIYQTFGVQINPADATGLDASKVNGTKGEMAGWMAPVIDDHQTYTDHLHLKREVEGVFGIPDPSLHLDTTIIVNKTYGFYSPVPPGKYMLACYTPRAKDCIAVSLQGQEYQIRPESIDVTISSTDFPTSPDVMYGFGSIHKCFRVVWHMICIRVF
jgi:hypothetical protein